MIIYQYDKSFDGLLTCIFEAYDRKMFPDILQAGRRESLFKTFPYPGGFAFIGNNPNYLFVE